MTTPFRQRPVAPDLTSPLPTPRSKISDWYQQYLGRTPDESGWDFWSNAAKAGTPLYDIQAAIQNSPEAIQYGQQPHNLVYGTGAGFETRPDNGLVKTYPDLVGTNFNPTFNANDVVKTPYTESRLSNNLGGLFPDIHGQDINAVSPFSPEIMNDTVTGDTFANSGPAPSFNDTLKTMFGGSDTYAPDLRTPLPGPSSSSNGLQFGNVLNNMYNQYLGRNAESEGANFWNNALMGGASEDSVRNAIANSPEAQQYAAMQSGLDSLK